MVVRPAARVMLLVIVLGSWMAASAAGQDPPLEVERLVFLLQYIGADYGAAVTEGRIVDAFEYQEMATFSGVLVDSFDVLRRRGAPETVAQELTRLQGLIRELRPWEDVRALASGLATRLLEELDLVAHPVAAPDPARGAELYTTLCASCHGPTGGGDGPAAAEQNPSPTSFREPRMNRLSPHQVFGATRFGIEGTAMASYSDTLSPAQSWDLAFHVLTLREDFEPAATHPGFDLSLEDLLAQSNDSLLARLLAEGLAARPVDVDYFRLHPPEPHPPLLATSSGSSRPPPGTVEGGDALGLALRLQDAFAAVAERVLPSVVNVTSFGRAEDAPPRAAADADSWTVADADAPTYPGFRRLKSGSGFFVSGDGYVLTGHHVVTREGGDAAEVIDVELPGGRRVLSRLVGAEPTLDLAVLKLEVVPEHRPPEVTPITIGEGEALRVGHWVIAVGDPWGPERTYAVGTLAARADRQCYQEQLTATLLQASLSVHPGSYGGPLVDIRGRVVGMIVPPPPMIAAHATEYALPIDLALNLYEALKVTESRRSPWLGVSVLELASARRHPGASREAPPDLPPTGVYIDDVFDPSPASRAGIRVGDTLVAIDGKRLLSVLDFQKWLYLSGIGRSVSLDVYRGGETLSKRATIEERPQAATNR